MKNFDTQEAIGYIVTKIISENPKLDMAKCRLLITKIMDIDFEFMRNAGVIVDDEFIPDAFYEDDEAFSYVAERASAETEGEDEQLLMDLLEDYFEYFEKYMEKSGMLSWE